MTLDSKDCILMMRDEDGNMKPIGSVLNKPPHFESEDVQTYMPVNRTYTFSCELAPESRNTIADVFADKSLKQAETMIERLNELSAQYNSGKLIRRERRAVKREYDRLSLMLLRHCDRWGITLKRKEQ